ncbi:MULTISPECIES: hypothetical protein [unclassified Methylophaga]|jgi:hypothetical protein|uniref:DUF7424 family protein n=1 Tax=unclassified Methylophaga TaxID=2629249 RepID=UPI000C901ECD|nr:MULTISPECIES: hypothetical protein [unclassified Methylophaga]MAK66351.1 hypothetical protein [Methylophaga sp.]MAY17045.1 hypothetical protein [Methylophaga sp.]HAO24370.1 hypothetical protein [Methylophaga sp.]HCD05205.1 hypothetical protein [Methylophaga sp.]|tara:strand:- start:34670 stop:35290 length:621 start_codon:yes stop_codon:yes gene_type:complete
MKKTILLPIFLILSACKVDTVIDVSTDQLRNETPENLTASLYLEIPSCNDYEDSRRESDSLVNAKAKTPQLFKGAEYVECFTQKMDTWAHFKIPVAIIKDSRSPVTDLNLVSNEFTLMGMAAKEDFVKRLEDENSRSYVSNDYYIEINLKTNEEFDIKVISAYLQDHPYTIGTGTFKKDATIKISLSDVSIDQLLTDHQVVILEYQ